MKTKSTSTKRSKLTVLVTTLSASACATAIGPTLAFAANPGPASPSSSLVDYVTYEAYKLYALIYAFADEVNVALEELGTTIFITLSALSFFSALIIAVLAEWLFRRQTADAAEMVRKRPGAVIGSGVVGIIAVPLAVVLLAVLGITFPVAQGVAFATLAMLSVATGFMAASLSRLVFKNMGRFKRALLAGAIVGAIAAIPYFGIVAYAIAFIYLLGYVLQSIYSNVRNTPSASKASADEEGSVADAQENAGEQEGEAEQGDAASQSDICRRKGGIA